MTRSIMKLAVVIALVLITVVGAALAQDCAPVFGGTGQEKLLQDIRACSQDVQRSHGSFNAFLNPDNCHISMAYPRNYSNIQANTFIQCMHQYGWTITGKDANGYWLYLEFNVY